MRGKGSSSGWLEHTSGITPAYAGKRTHSRLSRSVGQDHPRVCGEKRSETSLVMAVVGSPPRMRGKAKVDGFAADLKGITPAYAGKSSVRVEAGSYTWDHPRVCGEKTFTSLPQGGDSGSPPRMRGKAHHGLGLRQGHGITPAYAGKSSLGFDIGEHHRDHPRVCGEKRNWPRPGPCPSGSPPRMRGKATTAQAFPTAERDHPRVCGEKRGMQISTPFFQGSPPRMRGKALACAEQRRRPGITPAYAGKRRWSATPGDCGWDHPRVCGEKQLRQLPETRRTGSPPRMRGKASPCRSSSSGRRITPAYAGKSIVHQKAPWCSRDHPRVCGEKTKKIP